MSLGATFGKSNSKGSTSGTDNTNSVSNFTTAPVLPDWVTNLSKGLGSTITDLSATDPKSYVAGPNALLTTAGANATNLSGTPWDYDAAEQMTGAVGNAKTPDIAGDISRFMDPYLNSVVDATGADLDHQAGLTRAQQDLDLAGSGAFGGSGAALTKSATEGELARARATTLGGLRSQGFGLALGGATSQAQLQQQQQQQRLQAAQQLATIADQYGANSRANVATQAGTGGQLQAIDQAKSQAPLDFQAFLSQLFAGTLPQLYQGQTGTEDQSGTETTTGTSKGTTTKVGLSAGSGGS